MHGGDARDVEEVARFPSGNRAKGRRGIGRAEGGGADLGDGDTQHVGQDPERVDVRGLALISGHTERGVALDVLDRTEVLTHRKLEVGGGDVVLEVDPELAALAGRLVRGQQPQVADAQVAVVGVSRLRHRRRRRAVGPMADGLQRRGCGLGAIGQRLVEAEDPTAGTGRNARRGRVRRTGHEARGFSVEIELGAGLAVQVHDRVVAARGRQEVTGQHPGFAVDQRALTVHGRDFNARDPARAAGGNHSMASIDRHAQIAQAAGIGALALPAFPASAPVSDIDHGDIDPGVVGLDGGRQRHVVVDHENPTLPSADAVALQIGLDRTGKHNPGQVVVAEHQRALESTGGQHHLPGADPVPAHAGGVQPCLTGVEVVRHPLERGQHVVVENARQRGAGHDPDVGHGGEFSLDASDPCIGVLAVDGDRITQQRTTAQAVLLNQNHARAGLGGRAGRLQAGRTRANDDNIGVLIVRVIAADIGAFVTDPEPGSPADHRLDQAVPEPRADEEGLVVEARREEPRQQRVNRAQIEAERGEGVDRLGGQALTQFSHGCAVVGLARALFRFGDVAVDECVGLFDACRHDPARAVILERTADQMHAVGQQRRGNCIAAVALVGLAVKGEAQQLAAIDAAALGLAEFLAHWPPSAG